MNRSLTILLADDHAMFREMLSTHLSAEPDINVVGSTGNAEDAIAEAKTNKPDILLMDIGMSGLSSFEAARIIRTLCPQTSSTAT